MLKVLNVEMNHRNFQYKQGLNVDTVPFNPSGECQAGGLYYTDKENIFKFFCLGTQIVDVVVPEDARVYAEPYKWKADKIIISNFRSIQKFVNEEMNREEKLKMLEYNEYFLKYIKNPTLDLVLFAVARDGNALMFVENQTEQICLEAVKQNGCALQFVKNPTNDIIFAALKRHGWALKYVKNPTEEMCKIAIEENEQAFIFVPN